MIASSGIYVSLWHSLVTLGGCRHLDGLEQRWSLSGGWWLSLALIVVIVRGSWPFASGEPKGTLMDCSWLVWSSSCIGCVAPYWGFGMWSQLAREPPSEWIATTRTSLPASKWTSVKIIVFIIDSEVIGLYCYSSLWLIGSSSTRRFWNEFKKCFLDFC